MFGLSSFPFVLLILLSLPQVAAQSIESVTPIESPRLQNQTRFEYPLHLHGVARPKASAALRCLVVGTISKVHIQEGQSVRAGDPLITLDDRLVRAQLKIADIEAGKTADLNRAITQLKLAESRLTRLEAAFKNNASSKFELEEQRALVEQASAVHLGRLEEKELAVANQSLVAEQLRQLTVSAPFDGIVTQIHAKLGETVDPSMPVVSIANLEILEIEMHTPLNLYGTIRPGSKVFLRAGVPVRQSLTADVMFVSPMINSASGTFRCVLQIDNTQRALPAGFSVELASQAELAESSRFSQN